MNFLNKIFGSKDQPIKTNQDFWNWFQDNAQTFFKVVKQHKYVEQEFFDPLSKKLGALREGYFYLTGMLNDHTAELVLTADGVLANIPFVEALVADAPEINGWKFTASKPPHTLADSNITMNGYEFSQKTLSFYPNIDEAYPDEIDLTIVHQDCNESNVQEITNGVYIFTDIYLGELNAASGIDRLEVNGNINHDQLAPIEKLPDYLKWRKKEFTEKYEAIKYGSENDSYATLEAKVGNGSLLFASMNMTLLDWEYKASHPWAVHLIISFDGGENGLPDNDQAELLNAIEDELDKELVDFEGYLNVGRQVCEGERIVFFACKDFRLPSLVIDRISKNHGDDVKISYEIFKDKYWRFLERFQQ